MLNIFRRPSHNHLPYNKDIMIMVNTGNRFVVVEDLNHVFSLLNAEKLLSHS